MGNFNQTDFEKGFGVEPTTKKSAGNINSPISKIADLLAKQKTEDGIADATAQKAKAKAKFRAVETAATSREDDGYWEREEGIFPRHIAIYLKKEAKVPSFRDFGDKMKLAGGISEAAIFAMLRRADQRYGEFKVFGSDEFKSTCAMIAKRHGFRMAGIDAPAATVAHNEVENNQPPVCVG